MIDLVIRWRWTVIVSAARHRGLGVLPVELAGDQPPAGRAGARTLALTGRASCFPYQNIGSEFMPPLYEGDLLYMPTTFPGISPTKAREILQQTDKIIKTFPEVQHVFGKVGRAETATDPAPMDMIETTIMLKDEKDWPAVDIKDADGKVIAHRRRTPDELADALNAAVQIPGLEQRLDHADQDAHRHARHRHQDARRHQGRRAGPGGAGAHRLGDRSGGPQGSRHGQRVCRARRWAATTSSSTSTATRSPATA